MFDIIVEFDVMAIVERNILLHYGKSQVMHKCNFLLILTIESGSVKVANVYIKEDSIRVTWQLPECSGNIREIKVQYRKTGQSTWPWELKVPSTSDKEITIKGIEKGVEYEVRVVVIDTNGLAHKLIGTKVANTGKYSTQCYHYMSHINLTFLAGELMNLDWTFLLMDSFYFLSHYSRSSSLPVDPLLRKT